MIRSLLHLGLAVVFAFAAGTVRSAEAVKPMPRIAVSADGKGFVFAGTAERFQPWGANYGNAGRLMEDFWNEDWQTFADDFAEMRALKLNVVRVHLQFGKFMQAADRPDPGAFQQFARMLKLAEETGIYLDVTGLACYRPADNPAWYDALDDAGRWEAQAAFWRAVAEAGAQSPAIFSYDLMNEPVSPGAKTEKWYSGGLFGGYDFIQNIARDPAGRDRGDVAIAWIQKLTAAIREKDPTRLVTVGMLPWVTDWKHLSGFVPQKVAPHVDFLSVHIYPKTKIPEEAMFALKECDAGKPVVVEETFPIECSIEEFEAFLRASKSIATGWVFHYDGYTIAELDAVERSGKLSMVQALWRAAIRSVVKLRPELVSD